MVFSIFIEDPQFHRVIKTETICKLVENLIKSKTKSVESIQKQSVEINIALSKLIESQENNFDDDFKSNIIMGFLGSLKSLNLDDLFIINCNYDYPHSIYEQFSKIIYKLFITISDKFKIERQIEEPFIINNQNRKDSILFQYLFYYFVPLFSSAQNHVFCELFFGIMLQILEKKIDNFHLYI